MIGGCEHYLKVISAFDEEVKQVYKVLTALNDKFINIVKHKEHFLVFVSKLMNFVENLAFVLLINYFSFLISSMQTQVNSLS